MPRSNSKTAVLISYLLISVFFGFLHGNNPNATLVSSINVSLIGLFLGLAFILTGELAIPIGLHIAWNFTQGYVFGFPVSGSETHISLIGIHQTGPILWTGGAFGPEGGLIEPHRRVVGHAARLWMDTLDAPSNFGASRTESIFSVASEQRNGE